GDKPVAISWAGDYVRFDGKSGDELTITYPLLTFTHQVKGVWPQTAPKLEMTFKWLGNMVTSADPAPTKTALFTGKPRVLPHAPEIP
ncbi:MAG: hypothetical protein ABIP55_11110, partial [Tepidisphaeraceae bacterium]